MLVFSGSVKLASASRADRNEAARPAADCGSLPLHDDEGTAPVATNQPAMSPSGHAVADVLDRATGPRRDEADELVKMLGELSGSEPVVWAGRIIGFGAYTYRYESGHGGRAPLLAFAPGPQRHTIYLTTGFAERWPDILASLGPHRASKACLYLTRLSAVDRDALRALLQRALDDTRAEWP